MDTVQLEKVVVIVGNYGSGKTETAVSLALDRRRAGLDVNIVDLDLVNPYFRTREARDRLTRAGVHVILPEAQFMHADLPILSPKVAGAIDHPLDLTILDAGGDNVGATVLAALADRLSARKVDMLQVVNPFRPFTSDVTGCLQIRQEIEIASKLKVTGWVGNAHLMSDTTEADVKNGYELIRALSAETGIRAAFITAPQSLMAGIDRAEFFCPVLPIERKMTPPWRQGPKQE